MVSTVKQMNSDYNVPAATTNSFSAMESTEVSRSNSQERILLQKRRMQHSPRALNIQLAYQPALRRLSRPYHPMTHPRRDEVTESVKQANRERVKSLENELQITRQKLNEVSTENRTLQKLLRRHETTLKHYEGSETSLPQIMQAHDEDMRVVKAQLKQEKRCVRELMHRLKSRDDELAPLKLEYNKLLKLSRDQHLGARQQLAEQVERQEEIIKEQGEKILMLSRRLLLESKTNAHKLGVELGKTRDAQQQLSVATEHNERLKRLLEAKQKFIVGNAHRFAGRRGYSVASSQEGSTVSLGGTSFPGLAAHLKPDPDLPWLDTVFESESVCSSISARSKTALISRPSNVCLSNVRQTLRQKVSNGPSQIPPLELPSISKNASVESNVQSDDSVHSSDDDIMSYSSESTSHGGVSSRARESHVDSAKDSFDEGIDSEIQRIQAGSTNNDLEMSITLTKNTSHGSSGDERASRSEMGSRVVEKMTIVELEDDESQVEVSDEAEKKDSSKEKDELSDNDDALSEMEERLKLEKERTIELKAKFDKYMENESSATVNHVTIDLERKEKLLAALQAIDRGSPVKTTLSKADDRKQVSIFTQDGDLRQDYDFTQSVSTNHRPSDSNLISPASRPDLVNPFPNTFATEPPNQKPGLISELFGRSDVGQSNHKPSRHQLQDFTVSRNNMFDQLGHMSIGDSNNNNASTATNRF